MFLLPNDILSKIVDQLDVVSLVRLNSTCKGMRDGIGLSMKISEHPVQYLNKIDNRSYKYGNLNDMVDDILSEIQSPADACSSTLFKEYTTAQQQQSFTLQISRKSRLLKNKPLTQYSFSIKKKGARCSSFQLMYDACGDNYVCMRQIGAEVHLPLLFLYIGCKLIFKIHGCKEIACFREFPDWFKRILLCETYSGMLLKDIVNSYILI